METSLILQSITVTSLQVPLRCMVPSGVMIILINFFLHSLREWYIYEDPQKVATEPLNHAPSNWVYKFYLVPLICDSGSLLSSITLDFVYLNFCTENGYKETMQFSNQVVYYVKTRFKIWNLKENWDSKMFILLFHLSTQQNLLTMGFYICANY